jgi:hypothetical protein
MRYGRGPRSVIMRTSGSPALDSNITMGFSMSNYPFSD